MKRYFRLAFIVVIGIALMCLLAFGIYWTRDLLRSYGYDVSPITFLISFFVVVGGGVWIRREACDA